MDPYEEAEDYWKNYICGEDQSRIDEIYKKIDTNLPHIKKLADICIKNNMRFPRYCIANQIELDDDDFEDELYGFGGNVRKMKGSPERYSNVWIDKDRLLTDPILFDNESK